MTCDCGMDSAGLFRFCDQHNPRYPPSKFADANAPVPCPACKAEDARRSPKFVPGYFEDVDGSLHWVSESGIWDERFRATRMRLLMGLPWRGENYGG